AGDGTVDADADVFARCAGGSGPAAPLAARQGRHGPHRAAGGSVSPAGERRLFGVGGPGAGADRRHRCHAAGGGRDVGHLTGFDDVLGRTVSRLKGWARDKSLKVLRSFSFAREDKRRTKGGDGCGEGGKADVKLLLVVVQNKDSAKLSQALVEKGIRA